MVDCPNCNKYYNDDFDFCPYCGTKKPFPKVCPECNGEGRTSEWEDWENYHTGAPEKTLIHPICKTCHGKGYLEKKIKEVWE